MTERNTIDILVGEELARRREARESAERELREQSAQLVQTIRSELGELATQLSITCEDASDPLLASFVCYDVVWFLRKGYGISNGRELWRIRNSRDQWEGHAKRGELRAGIIRTLADFVERTGR